jgi:glycosyltransferase involved in cell wall biosynthesis
MTEPLDMMHIFRSQPRPVADLALRLIARVPRRLFRTTVAGELDAATKRRLESSQAHWVQMPLPTGVEPLRQLETARRLARLLENQGTRVVHAHGFQAAFTALSARRQVSAHPPVICTPYGPPHLGARTGLRRHSVAAAASWVLQHADVVTVQSEAELQQMEELTTRGLTNVVVVPEGVDLEPLRADFEAGAKRRMVGLDAGAAIVGVMAAPEGRGIDDFLQAAHRVSLAMPNVEFVLLGHGAKTEEFAQKAHELGLAGATVFLGDRADIIEIIASLNLLVIPAEYIGARRHALHALANNIPLVVTTDGGLPEVVTDVQLAKAVPMGDTTALERTIAALLDTVPGAAGTDMIVEELGINYSEMLIPEVVLDLDRPGLQLLSERELSEQERDVLHTIERFSMTKIAGRFTELYLQVANDRRSSKQGDV